MATVTATYDGVLTAVETVALGLDNVTDKPVTHTLGTLGGTLTSATTPPVTEAWSDDVALTAGAATLDLQALAKGNLANLNLSGLKIQMVIFRNPSTNAGNMTISDGAANGYNIFGDASGQVTLLPGCWIACFWNDKLDDVAAADSEIDIAGTGTESLEIVMVAG